MKRTTDRSKRLMALAITTAVLATGAFATIRADEEEGCCGSEDCSTIGNNPYHPCILGEAGDNACAYAPVGPPSQYPKCCDTQGWCGDEG